MRIIEFIEIEKSIIELCLKAAYDLPKDVAASLRESIFNESSLTAKSIIEQCIKNFEIASNERVPICQDTGFAVYFVEIGRDVSVVGGTIEDAITAGTIKGYDKGYLRKSIVSDPLFDRKNTATNTPAVIHTKNVSGDQIRITLAPKGGGSENMSFIKMLKPSDGVEGVKKFIVEKVIESGGNPCPPVIVGVGIGGTFERCAYLAKEALLRPIKEENVDKRYAQLEKEILKEINVSGVGPQGLGGDTTALAVHINQMACHLASLPVAVNINCHAARHAEISI